MFYIKDNSRKNVYPYEIYGVYAFLASSILYHRYWTLIIVSYCILLNLLF